MFIEISSEHGRHGCQWSVKHDQCPPWTWNGVPTSAHWLSDLAAAGVCCEGARLALDDSTFRNDLDAQFEQIVGTIRHDVHCDLCWPDVKDRRQVAAARRARGSALFGREQREPVAVASARATGNPPTSYATARRRYMQTGTIAHKEAMLEFVTDAEPDLEKLGSEWEPEPARAARTLGFDRRRASVALTVGAAALAVFHGLLLNGWAFLTWMAFVMLATAWTMSNRKPEARP